MSVVLVLGTLKKSHVTMVLTFVVQYGLLYRWEFPVMITRPVVIMSIFPLVMQEH